jgi:uncharacterized protein YlzI (FlbEa/FlbD family)
MIVIDDDGSMFQVNSHQISKIEWSVEMQMSSGQIYVLEIAQLDWVVEEVVRPIGRTRPGSRHDHMNLSRKKTDARENCWGLRIECEVCGVANA